MSRVLSEVYSVLSGLQVHAALGSLPLSDNYLDIGDINTESEGYMTYAFATVTVN